MANHTGDAMKMATTSTVRKITTDNAAAKNTILSQNEPLTRGIYEPETYAQIRSANGRHSMRARLSRPSIERDIPTMNEACGHR
jgi:hypothetical protein